MSLGARDYVGVDTQPGPGVDRLCDVATLASEFSERSFDVVVTTEMLEHVRDWRIAITNLKRVVAPEGLLLITTRSFGFPYHDFPGDYWRYELDDMRTVFRDFQILRLLPDPQSPGVFLKCRKPPDFKEIDTSAVTLFSVVKARRSRVEELGDGEIGAYAKHMKDLSAMGNDIAKTLLSLNLADLGGRDFRVVWRSLERVSDELERLSRSAGTPVSPLPPAGFSRPKRWLLDLVTATRLARGRSCQRARKAVLESVLGALYLRGLCVPWASIDDRSFREIVSGLEEVRSLTIKMSTYARPAESA